LFNKALKWFYTLILGYLLRAQFLVAFSFFNFEYLVLAILSLLFFVCYVLYLVVNRRRFLTLAISFYFIYSALFVWKTYLHPLISPQEYIAAIVVFSVLGVPMLVLFFRNFKHNKQRQRTHKSAPLL
jgi:ABC-type multidrug transport system permease subunit